MWGRLGQTWLLSVVFRKVPKPWLINHAVFAAGVQTDCKQALKNVSWRAGRHCVDIFRHEWRQILSTTSTRRLALRGSAALRRNFFRCWRRQYLGISRTNPKLTLAEDDPSNPNFYRDRVSHIQLPSRIEFFVDLNNQLLICTSSV